MPDIFFNGPAGRLEGRFAESVNPNAPIALVLHPHPQNGGTMNNKVVYNVYKQLFENEFTVLRINFRGVGRSIGEFDNGVGEMMDAATALDWLQINYPMSKTTLIAGFSFGSWIAMQLIMRRPEITNFIAVSPPVNKYDFSFLSPCPIPGLIIQGDQDSVVPEEPVHEFAQRLIKQRSVDIQYKLISGADHFFRDKIDSMNEEIDNYLKNKFNHHMQPPQNRTSEQKQEAPTKMIYLD